MLFEIKELKSEILSDPVENLTSNPALAVEQITGWCIQILDILEKIEMMALGRKVINENEMGYLLEEECHLCRGQGKITHPEWLEYWDAYMLKKEEIEEKNSNLKWSEIDNVVKTELEKMGVTEPLDKPEEIVCPICNGKGDVLTSYGKTLLHFLKRHWDEI
ncbi:hypothetical protein BVF91_05940 [Thermoanaerobacterium sp. PSU-2]|uniref:hypothetical protein n=1 Tax=Thermoanaerobacterium sp. PSU-2 TaxID=1930849 RepID=UPI000A148AAF|nr:hypothetical protein [Thermoanaerobacterium sp. PSU-2]ORX23370.1 hypothetical protein BVF91_05940 [Thermoanaerobacterium sp. PSU-2]